MKKILPLFSYFFHPIFIAVYATILYFILNTDRYFIYNIVYSYTIKVLFFSVFIPLTIFYLLVSFNKIDSIMVTDVSQRKLPLALQILLFFILTKFVITIDNFPELYFFFVGSLISSLVAFILVFLKKKVSLHLLGISSLTVFIIGVNLHYHVFSFNLIFLLLLSIGFVASSRLFMKAHTIKELIWGGLIGIFPQLLLFTFWL